MIKEVLTFNKSDWSGEMVTVEFVDFAGGIDFVLAGESYRIVNEFRIPDNNAKFAWTQYDVEQFDGRKWNASGVKVGKADSDRYWLATDDSGEFTRDDKDARVAVCQLLSFFG